MTFKIALPLAVAAIFASSPLAAAELALKRAVLGTGGVGYFEYAAEVDGAEPLTLRARLDQVDDILKSLIVIDPAGPASITLPGKAGAAEAFASLPFSAEDLASLPALIGALKGAVVSVEAPRKLSGAIVSAVSATIKDDKGGEREITRVSLLSGVGVEQFVLEEAEGLKFDDSKIGAQVETALKALRAARDKSGRDIAIRLSAGGARSVRLGYVAEVPVWKAAYRLSLPRGEGMARLQGWAVLENMTGAEWRDVSLTLTAGSPVTFRQALYEPYYVARQTVAPPVSKLALPRMDQGQVAGLAERDVEEAAPAARRPMAAAAPMRAKAGAFDAVASAPAPASILGAAAASADGAENLSGASFTLTAPVHALAGESLSLPFVDMEIAAGQTAWAQSGASSLNPWNAVRLDNAGEVTLPAGSVTLYETAEAGPLFAGEAQLAILPPAQTQLIAFGADQKSKVVSETQSSGEVVGVSFSKGAMTINRLFSEDTVYRLANMDSKPRHMIVEHPFQQGVTATFEPSLVVARAENVYRIEKDVAPGQTERIEVITTKPIEQSFIIGGLTRSSLAQALGGSWRGSEAFTALLSRAAITPAMRELLAKIADAAGALEDQKRKLEALNAERDGIFADQQRLRANLAAAGAATDLGKQMTRKLLAEETRLDAIMAETQAVNAAIDAARLALESLAARPDLGQRQDKYDTKQGFKFSDGKTL